VRLKILVDSENTDSSKSVLSSTNPDAFRPAFSIVGWRILSLIAKKPSYPAEIARELNIHHQTAYYHIHRLERAGLIKKQMTTEVRGGRAVLYNALSDGFAIEFREQGSFKKQIRAARPKFLSFFKEFVGSGSLEGWIVVGSPVPHGKNNTQARDGHYAVQLGFALGQHVALPSRFPVKLDVDVKAERLEQSNMILVGGPRTNLLSEEINSSLPFRFEEEGFWNSIVDESGKKYTSEYDSIVAKVKNPWDKRKVCVIVAGISGAGTKAGIIAITNQSERILSEYTSGEASFILRGRDRDGDGKVDTAELLKQL
jgi:DNA-binding PadR family transcriptional regulator